MAYKATARKWHVPLLTVHWLKKGHMVQPGTMNNVPTERNGRIFQHYHNLPQLLSYSLKNLSSNSLFSGLYSDFGKINLSGPLGVNTSGPSV